VTLGDTLTYELKVTSTGTANLTNILVSDSLGQNIYETLGDPTSLDNNIEFLAAGAMESRYFDYQVTAADVTAGEIVNTGTADPDQTPPVTDPEMVPVNEIVDPGPIFPYDPPGVRTPGFWGQTKWQTFWDGIQENEPDPQRTQPNFPGSDLFHPLYTNSAEPGKVLDPVTGSYQTGVLIGDYDRNGMTSAGENTLFYTTAQALQIINASNKVQQDKRYTLGRSLLASWLNYLAGNPIDTAVVGDMDTRYYIDEGIDWLQALTPDENGDHKGDGALAGLVDSTVNSPAIPASSDFWNLGITDAASLPDPYNTNTNVLYPVDAGNAIHGALDAYNNFGTGADGAFPG
jgi:hypothetical protein